MPVPLQRMLRKARSCFGAQCQAHPSAAEYMHGGNRLRDQTGTRTMDSSEKDQEKFPHARSYQLQARRRSRPGDHGARLRRWNHPLRAVLRPGAHLDCLVRRYLCRRWAQRSPSPAVGHDSSAGGLHTSTRQQVGKRNIKRPIRALLPGWGASTSATCPSPTKGKVRRIG